MPNKLLKPNKGKRGSYTIKVGKNFSIPKESESVREIFSRISQPLNRSKICNLEVTNNESAEKTIKVSG